MEKPDIVIDPSGNRVVLIPDIIFKNKQNIDWDEVEEYLQRYVGKIVEVTETKDIVYIGKEFPDEYAGSKYTRKMKGARAKAKANAAQRVLNLVENAAEKNFMENCKEKHNSDAAKGWYYYKTRFALPVYGNERKTGEYSLYTGRLVINRTAGGKMYLYDLVDIKKEASNPLKTV